MPGRSRRPVESTRPAEPTVERAGQGLSGSLQRIAGVGPKRAKLLERHGLQTIADLLYHIPFRYQDRRTRVAVASLAVGQDAMSVVRVVSVREGRPRPAFVARGRGRGLERTIEATARDETGEVGLVWFRQPVRVAPRCEPGQRVMVYGRVESEGESLRFVHPDVEVLGEAAVDARVVGPAATATAPGSLVPVYTKPMGMTAGVMRKIVRDGVAGWADRLRGALSDETVRRHGLMDLADAVRFLHEPPRHADLEELEGGSSTAHRSLIFEELLRLQLALERRRKAIARTPGVSFPRRSGLLEHLRTQLPFELTGAQQRVLREILDDMALPRPMRRLVQGDVGSGKTVVALLAAVVAVDAGYSAAIMAPTEVLAEQHLGTFRRLLGPLGIDVELLTGSVTGKARALVLEKLSSMQPTVIVGTHALAQETVSIPGLGLVVVDEQHRFGVLQRRALKERGGSRSTSAHSAAAPVPDCLVMSATPIPRTLAMTVFGDLDVSVLDERPKSRKPIRTHLASEASRPQVYRAARSALERGEQVFVVFPLVDESPNDEDLRAASSTVAALRATSLAGFEVGLLHGRMSAGEKEKAMGRFRRGETRALVCTSVIEVGVDVPSATVMIIEHADRFGLAQLHQMRGRVGRGAIAAECYLVGSADASPASLDRLRVLERTEDGARIAEEDLRSRGPGEFLGTRQAGLPPLRLASLLRDVELLEAARAEARRVLEARPTAD